MFPAEIIILLSMVSTLEGDSSYKSRLAGMDEYVDYLYRSLVWRGFLETSGDSAFRMTSMGETELKQFLEENTSRARTIIESLHKLGIESAHKFEELSMGKTG